MLKRVASHWPRDFCALHRAKRLQIHPLCSLQAYARSNACCVVGGGSSGGLGGVHGGGVFIGGARLDLRGRHARISLHQSLTRIGASHKSCLESVSSDLEPAMRIRLIDLRFRGSDGGAAPLAIASLLQKWLKWCTVRCLSRESSSCRSKALFAPRA